MANKDLCFKQVHKYARLKKKSLAKFRVHMKQYRNFQRDTTTKDTFCESSFKTILTFSGSYY